MKRVNPINGNFTTMTTIAAEAMGLPVDNITIEMGCTGLPPGPTQGGSSVTSSVGATVHDICAALKEKFTAFTNKEGIS